MKKKSLLWIGLAILILMFSLMGCTGLFPGPEEDKDKNGEAPTEKVRVYLLTQPYGNVQGSIAILNPETNEIGAPVPTKGTIPNTIKVYNGKGYIANSGSHDVQIFNPNDLSDLGTIVTGDGSGSGTGGNPWDIVFFGSKAYVSNNIDADGNGDHTVSVADLSTDKVTSQISGWTTKPSNMLVLGDKLYVSSGVNPDYTYGQGTVTVIDTNSSSVVATINVGVNPGEIAVDKDGEIHVVCTGDYITVSGKVSVINPANNTVKATINIGTSVSSIAISPDNKIYVSGGFGAGTYSYSATNETDSTTVTSIGSLSGNGGNIAISKAGMAYIADQGSDKLYILNTSNDTLIKTLDVVKAYKVWIEE